MGIVYCGTWRSVIADQNWHYCRENGLHTSHFGTLRRDGGKIELWKKWRWECLDARFGLETDAQMRLGWRFLFRLFLVAAGRDLGLWCPVLRTPAFALYRRKAVAEDGGRQSAD